MDFSLFVVKNKYKHNYGCINGVEMAKKNKSVFGMSVDLLRLLIIRRWLIVGSIGGLLLTGISMYFNATVGYWSASSPLSCIAMAVAYAALDLGLLFLVSQLSTGIESFFLKWSSVLCSFLLIMLSAFAGMTFFAAQDSEHEIKIKERQIERMEKKIELSDMRNEVWINNLKNTKQNMSRFDEKLESSLSHSDDYSDEITKLEESKLPPALIIFSKFEPYIKKIAPHISSEDFQIIIRTAFGLGIIFSSFLCVAVAHSASTKKKKAKSIIGLIISNKKKEIISKLEDSSRNPKSSKSRVTLSVADFELYEKIKNEVLSGDCEVNYNSIKGFGVGSNKASAIIKRLAKEGVIKKIGREYKLIDTTRLKKPVLQIVNT